MKSAAKPILNHAVLESLEGRQLFTSLLTGSAIGTPGSWNNTGNTIAKAFDANPATFFDSPQSDYSTVGLDLGSPQVPTSIRFAPRAGYAWRMAGGQFQASNDNSTWTTLATVTSTPAEDYTTLNLTNSAAYRYVRYLSPAGGYGNISEFELYGTIPTSSLIAVPGTTTSTPVKLTGTPFGTAGSWNNVGNTFDKAEDGDASTFFDAPTPSAAAVGTDLGAAKRITSIRFVPRSAYAGRMTGGKFQGSNDNAAWTTLATITSDPTVGYNTLAVTDTASYRYVRYLAPSDSYGNIAEVEFYGTSLTTSSPTPDPVSNVTTPVANAPHAAITLLESTVTAGNAIHANAVTASTLNSGTPVSARYDWNFGDPAGKYNTLSGFNAAHVYDTPGTYTISLTVTDDQNRATTTTSTVTISADTRRTLYVDSVNGNDTNTGLSPSSPLKSANRAFQLISDNTKVLFNRGGTYPVTASLVLPNNVLVGAYGTGAKPTVTWAGGTQPWWEIFAGSAVAHDDVVRDLLIDGGPNSVTGVAPRGTNFAVINCDFTRLETAINAAGNPTGLLVQDNAQANGAGVYDYFLWLQGTDAVVVGNSVGTGGMYGIRTSGANGQTIARALFANNTLSNDQRSNLRVQRGSYVYITNNTITTSAVEFGPQGTSDGFSDPNWATSHTSYVVFESNSVTLAASKYVRLTAGLEHVSVRNNVVRHDADGAAIAIEGFDPAFNRIVADATIANNTIIDNGTTGIGIQLQGPENSPEVTITHNLFVSPNLIAAASTGSATIWISDASMTSLRLVSGNIWSAPKTESYVGPLAYVYVAGASTTNFITPTQWDAYSNVQGDLFTNATLGTTFQFTLNNTTAGANLPKA